MFIFIGVWFFFELLAGVLFTNFLISKKNAQHSFLTQNQIEWIEIQKKILNQNSVKFLPPKKCFKNIYEFFKHKNFDLFLQLIFLANVLIFAIYTENKQKNTNFFQKNSEKLIIFFAILYSIEAFLKILCLGLKQYAIYHTLELIIFISYNIDILINIILKNNIKFSSPEMDLKFFRITSLLKSFIFIRLFKKLKFIENILKSLKFIMPLIINMLGLFVVNLFIFSILGCFLFGNIVKGMIIDEYVNFKNVFYGMMTLFKCTTGDDWSKIMLDTMRSNNCTPFYITCGSSYFSHYFIF